MTISERPLLAGMRRASRINPYFELPLQGADSANWVSAADLFLGDPLRLRRLMLAYGEAAWGSANPHMAGSAFIIAYLTRLIWPVIGQWLLEGRVMDAALDNIAFHFNGEGIDATALRRPAFAALPSDPAAEHPDAAPVPDAAALYAELKRRLFQANLIPVIEALRQAGASAKVSQNAAASACAQAFHHLYPIAPQPEALTQAAARLFGDPETPVFRQVTMEVFEHGERRSFLARRRGCCLAWRIRDEGGYCSNCVLLPRAEQDMRFRQMMGNGRLISV